MAAADPRKAAIDLLAFYQEAGVEAALDEEPVDRFAESAAEAEREEKKIISPLAGGRLASSASREGEKPQARAQTFAPFPNPSPPGGRENLIGAEAAVTAARTGAISAATLDELKETLARFEGCALKATAKNLVFADGNPQARVMFVGEAPGAEEDREGLPFVGRSGKLLDRMLAAIGLDRASAYIANIVPWRPPGNRTPTPQEAAICLPFIRRQIELANPDILVCLGGPAAQTLLGVKEGITRTRGRWFDYDTGTRTIRALATFHPAYLLRTPAAKRLAWRDFLALKKALAK